jgi:hypothetical protein
LFKYTGDKTRTFVNFQYTKRVLTTSTNDQEGQAINVQNNNGSTGQRWSVLYLDKKGKTETSGLNEEFGFYINRPFYLVSELPFNRVAESPGANNVVLKRWRKNWIRQQFYFDEVSKTIRSQQWKNYALEIQGNGGSNNLRLTSGINSRWW